MVCNYVMLYVAADVILIGVDKILCTRITLEQIIIEVTEVRFQRENYYATCQLFNLLARFD